MKRVQVNDVAVALPGAGVRPKVFSRGVGDHQRVPAQPVLAGGAGAVALLLAAGERASDEPPHDVADAVAADVAVAAATVGLDVPVQVVGVFGARERGVVARLRRHHGNVLTFQAQEQERHRYNGCNGPQRSHGEARAALTRR